ncbi:MAG: hypothetical protein AAGE84_05965 [Cyanobacteria bacterium P01_G01_bin.39]
MNWRPSASDWCEFPHSLDYPFTVGIKIPLGGGRYVTDILRVSLNPNKPFPDFISATSLCTFSTRNYRAWLKITMIAIHNFRLP